MKIRLQFTLLYKIIEEVCGWNPIVGLKHVFVDLSSANITTGILPILQDPPLINYLMWNRIHQYVAVKKIRIALLRVERCFLQRK